MKKIVGYTLAAVVVALAFGYASGIFKVDANIQIDKNAKREVLESSYEVLDKAQKSTDETFNTIKKYIKED